LELARLIHEDSTNPIKHTVLVSSASHTDIEEIDRYFDASITKPVKRTTLYETLANVLNGDHLGADTESPPELRLFSGNVLLVEDNVVNQMLAQEMLRKHGVEVVVMDNGYKAVMEASVTRFDLILMDIQMPVMDGYEATRQMRNHEIRMKLTETPIVALTANALNGDDQACFEVGMNDYMSKPFSEAMLLRILKKYLAAKIPASEDDSRENAASS